MIKFQAGQLLSSLEKYRLENLTGTAKVEVFDIEASHSKVKSLVIAFKDGMITFADKEFPSPQTFAKIIQQKLNIPHIEVALKVSAGRVKNKDSIRELFEFIARFGLFQWPELEAMLYKDTLFLLEQILPYPGQLSPTPEVVFDLSYDSDRHGFDGKKLQEDLQQRQHLWNALAPGIPQMNAVPMQTQHPSIPLEVLRHIEQWINNQQSLGDIAQKINQDPLELAKQYAFWREQGWINFKSHSRSAPNPSYSQSVSAQPNSQSIPANKPNSAPSASQALPIVLSVDDSSIVQTMIKRAISDRYQVMMANSAIEALNVLNVHPVALLLLDVTMPDIDGLELCRTIRQISKFRNLPIVMLTAKDGLVDKAKGQFAGATHYLNKPVDREKLLPVLEKYIPAQVTV